MNNFLKKKHIIFLICLVLIFTLFSKRVYASSYIRADKNQSRLLVDGREISFDAYTINNFNYFKLRDLAQALNGTNKKFDVIWNQDLKSIQLDLGQDYKTIDNANTSINSSSNRVYAKATRANLYIGSKYKKLDAYIINEYNHFKLRDLGQELDFAIIWNSKKNMIEIDTSLTYQEGIDKQKQINKESASEMDQISYMEKEVIRLTNLERQKYGLKPFKEDLNLAKVARIKSNDMIQNNYFDHTSPVYGSLMNILDRHKINYRRAGENIAYGQATPEEVVIAWMNSQGHRANILNPNFQTIGVGLEINNNNTKYWTQIFTN